MADLIVWQGMPTKERATLCVRADESGTITVSGPTIDTVTATVDTSTADGVVKIDIGGLRPDARHNVTITHDGGGSATARIKTMPPDDHPFTMVWVSCHDRLADFWPGYQWAAQDPLFMVHLGDYTYHHQITNWGEEVFGQTGSRDQSNAYNMFRQLRRMPGMKAFQADIPGLYQIDDHDRHIENDWSFETSATIGSFGFADATAVEQAYVQMRTAFDAYGSKGNGDAPANSNDVPSGNLTLASSVFTPHYWKVSQGGVDFWILNCIDGRSPLSATDDANKTMLGVNQRTWLLDGVANSTAGMQAIVNPKNFLGPTNSDSWEGGNYDTEKDTILNSILDGTKTGIMGLTGDKHHPHVSYIDQSKGHPYSAHFVQVCACPARQQLFDVGKRTSTGGATNAFVYLSKSPYYFCYGRAKFFPGSHAILDIVDNRGQVRWRGRVNVGSNNLVYQSKKTAI